MKRILIVAVVLALTAILHAQTPDASIAKPARTPHWTLGLTGGVDRNYHQIDMSYMSDMKYDKYCPGVTAGFSACYNPWKWLGLRADVALVQKNYHMDHVSMLGSRTFAITQTTTVNDYLNVPLVFDLSFGRGVRIHLMGGGYVGYWLASRREGVSYSMTDMMYNDELANVFDEEVPFNETRDNRLDAGFTWGVAASVKIWRELCLGAEIRWYYGVLDIQNDYMRNLNPRYNTTIAYQGGITYSL